MSPLLRKSSQALAIACAFEENSKSLLLPASEPLLPPPLKWAGGKRWLVPTLQPFFKAWQETLFPESRRKARSFQQVSGPFSGQLLEPFCGGLSVALGLQPQQAVLNDINPHVIAFYRQLQQGFKLAQLKVLPAFENTETFYYQARERFNTLISQQQAHTPEASAWFYYLNKTGYNGLCRFNRQGLYNVPFGRYKTIAYQHDFSAYEAVLKNWRFDSEDFEALSSSRHDFIYADPPYDVPFTSYFSGGFGWEDQVRLAQWLAKQPARVIASNQATPRILALYEDLGFTIQTVQAPRMIACTGNRSKVTEMLAFKGF